LNRTPFARRLPTLKRLSAALLACSLCLPPAWAQRNALPSLGEGESISLSAERQLGDRIARELYRDPDYLEDPVLDEYIQRLWAPLVQSAAARGELSPELRERFAWRLLLGRDRSVNAFALPGGYLGVHLGLIAVVSSDDELASVLAHELSHVTQRHIARSMESQGKMTPWMLGSMILGALAASKSPQGAQALIVGGQAAAIQSQLSYTRDMEREADRVGFGVMSEAGYDPRGFVGMFGKLQQAAGVNDNGAFPYLRSHPLTTERIADMQGRVQLTPPVRSASAHEFVQALLAARARVLSQNSVDALRAWITGAQNLSDNLPARERAGRLYAASLAHMQLRDWVSANQSIQALELSVQLRPDAARLVRLLKAEAAAMQNDSAQVVRLLPVPSPSVKLARPELIALAQALTHLPSQAGPHAEVIQQLRELIVASPADAQAWQVLAGLLRSQGQTVAALRAEGESQWVKMDITGAIDRLRAAQDLMRSDRRQAADHIEASIVDARLRQFQTQLREMQQEQRRGAL
jgi:predicted Zn-dependent protease